MKVNHRLTATQRRKIRVSRKIRGTAERPRLSVVKSNKHIYVQVIDDNTQMTLAAVNDLQEDIKKSVAGKKKVEAAEIVAENLVVKLKSQKIQAVVFDRGHARYHGRVRAIADQLRKLGINL